MGDKSRISKKCGKAEEWLDKPYSFQLYCIDVIKALLQMGYNSLRVFALTQYFE